MGSSLQSAGSSSLTRNRTWVPALGVQNLKHRTTRETLRVKQLAELTREEAFFSLCSREGQDGNIF